MTVQDIRQAIEKANRQIAELDNRLCDCQSEYEREWLLEERDQCYREVKSYKTMLEGVLTW